MSDSEVIQIQIDDQTLSVKPGTMLIQAADNAGIEIPRFCYHKKLSVAANCRMCLVEVERSGKPLPACATPVADGMKVWTKSEKAKAAQEDVMAFLLINHPLDCPICDQGGECELQDVAVGYGKNKSNYTEMKRVVKDKDIGPLIQTEMTRCIHCTRCVRFGEEVAGLRELGATGRGENMEIGTYIAKSVASEISGNVIDLCPVGALTAKPSRYKARAWEMKSYDSIACHDAMGSPVAVHSFDGEAVRVIPRENEAINQCWLSDRDRFAYEGLYSKSRLLHPMIKQDGQWQTTDWQTVLPLVANMLKGFDATNSGALANANASTESLYLFQALMRGLGVKNIDHRLRQTNFDRLVPEAAPTMTEGFTALAEADAVVMVGANLRQELPLLNLRVKAAQEAGAAIFAFNPRELSFNYDVVQQVAAPGVLVDKVAALVVAAADQAGQKIPDYCQALCQGVTADEQAKVIAAALKEAQQGVVLTGVMTEHMPQRPMLRALCQALAELTDVRFEAVATQANSVGAFKAGVLPDLTPAGAIDFDQHGLNVMEMLEADLKHYCLLDAEIEDFSDPSKASKAFRQAETVIAMTTMVSPMLMDAATVLLPISPYTETAGTYINAQQDWQTIAGCCQAVGDSRPAWKLLRVLGTGLDLSGFDAVSAADVLKTFKGQLDEQSQSLPATEQVDATPSAGGMQRIGDVHPYCVDSITRRAKSLQFTVANDQVRLNGADIQALGLSVGDFVEVHQGEQRTDARLAQDDGLPVGCVGLHSGTKVSRKLAAAFGPIDVRPLEIN